MGLILLVRHGQASFGAANYDELSPLGHAQARRLGATLPVPDRVVAGTLHRQQDTATSLGWGLPVETDGRWDEFDHTGLVAASVPPEEAAAAQQDSRLFQQHLETAIRGWLGTPSYAAWRDGAAAALADVVAAGGTTVVVSSGGVIARLVTDLLGAGDETWLRLNRVAINTGVTKVISGRRGVSLVSFNEAGHLTPDELSYR